jgi:hypothetical protein
MYKAILFHPEGDFVTDFPRKNVDDVWHEIAEMGSRWIFYPIPFVGTDKTIVDVSDDAPQWWKGKRIKTIQKYLKQTWKEHAQEICDKLNSGNWPLDGIYTD